jgi:tol-pal system protein YbgF
MSAWAAAAALLTLGGCLAQQADLIQTRAELEEHITALNKKEKEIREKIKQVDGLIDQQRQQVTKLTEQSASLNSQLSELQQDALAKIEGAQEKQNKRIEDYARRLDDQLLRTRGENDRRLGETEKDLREQLAGLKAEYGTRLAALEGGVKEVDKGLTTRAKADREDLIKLRTRVEETNAAVIEVTKRLEARIQEHDRSLGAVEAKAGGLAQQLDQQGRSVGEQLAQFTRALADFKIVLTGIGDRLAQQEHLTQELARRAEDLTAKTTTLISRGEADAKATAAHLAEVNRSVASVAKALEHLGTTLSVRIDEEDRRLNEMHTSFASVAPALQQHGQKVEELTGVVNSVAAQVHQQEQRLAEVASTLQTIGAPPAAPAAGQNLTPPHDTPEAGSTKRGLKPSKRQGASGIEERPASTSALPNPGISGDAPSSGGDAAAAALQPGPAGPSVDGAERTPTARDMYDAVMAKFRRGDLDGAQQGFAEFLTQYPASELAPNAQYWLGECLYGKKDYRRAIEAFNQVRQVYPRSEKVPAALLKASFAYIEVNERARAAALLKEIVSSYPKSPEAGKAGAKLAQLERKRS